MKRTKKMIAVIAMCTMTMTGLTGCFASFGNDKAVNGGYFSDEKGDYVILNESGGKIMDCWVLRDTYVDSEHASDGLRFADKDGNGIKVQGDAKVKRFNSGHIDTKLYVEYHIEEQGISYEEYKAQVNGTK